MTAALSRKRRASGPSGRRGPEAAARLPVVSVTMPRETKAALDAAATRAGLTRTAAVLEAIGAWLEARRTEGV